MSTRQAARVPLPQQNSGSPTHNISPPQILILQLKCFHEIISIGHSTWPKALPLFRSLSWYFLLAANYFFYGENFTPLLQEFFAGSTVSERLFACRVLVRMLVLGGRKLACIVADNPFCWVWQGQASTIIQYHRFLSFWLYVIGTVNALPKPCHPLSSLVKLPLAMPAHPSDALPSFIVRLCHVCSLPARGLLQVPVQAVWVDAPGPPAGCGHQPAHCAQYLRRPHLVHSCLQATFCLLASSSPLLAPIACLPSAFACKQSIV